jgi:hypothetical protein
LREFAPKRPTNIWYRWPVHEADFAGVLTDAEIKDTVREFAKKGSKRASEKRAAERVRRAKEFSDAVAAANYGEPPTAAQVRAYMGLDETKGDKDKFDRILKSHGGFTRRRDEASNTWVIVEKEVM